MKHGWVVLIGSVAMVAAASTPTSVVPGGVVRWPGGAEVTGCLAAGERFAPIGGDCIYGIDLLTAAGSYELGRSFGDRLETTTIQVEAYPYPEQRLEVAPSKVDLSAEDAARARRESARVGEVLARRTDRRFELPLAAPLDEMPEPRSFGARRVFNDQPRSPHTGVDLSVPTGTPVHAVAAGTVVLAEELFFGGNTVIVDHGDGLLSLSMHLSRIDVARGTTVDRGEVLGAVGATGRVTGPHLHFAVRWRGARVDPMPLLGPVGALPRP